MFVVPSAAMFEQRKESSNRKRKVKQKVATKFSPRHGGHSGLSYSPGAGTDFAQQYIANPIVDMLKDTAVSAGQIANESANRGIGMGPLGVVLPRLFGNDYLARGAGIFNKDIQQSMQGEVTPMDVANVASFAPIPAGAGARAGILGLKLAERMIPRTGFLEPAAELVGGGMTTRLPEGFKNVDKIINYGRGITPGANVLEATTEAVLNPSGRHRSGRSIKSYHAKKERERTPIRVSKAKYTNTTRSTGLTAKEWELFANEAAQANPRYIEAKLKSRPPWWKYVYNRANIVYDKLPESMKYYYEQVAGKEWESGHNLRSGLRGKVTHIVSGELNQLANSAQAAGVKLLTDKNYRPVIEWALNNNPKYAGYKSVEELADALGANHLMGYSKTKLKEIIAGNF